MRGAISMFRPMRRFKQALSPEECRAVLERGTSGVLALSGDGDRKSTRLNSSH